MYIVDNGLSTKGHLFILEDGRFECHPLKDIPELEDIQSAVRGRIEMIPHFETYEGVPCMAFCNEDGKQDGMPFSHPANEAWRIAYKAKKGKLPQPQYIAGPVVIITGNKEIMEAL